MIPPSITQDSSEMFRPPINRVMRALDRSFFGKNIPISAAKVRDRKNVSRLRSDLQKDLLNLERMQSVQNVRNTQGEVGKALLLRPEIRLDDASTWSPRLSELVKTGDVALIPYELELNYDYWDYHDIMSSIMPGEVQDEYPTGFSIVGHVVHLNLREEQLAYKHLIAAVLLDKVPNIRTVINKIDDVGSTNVYRTFSHEVLGGDPDLNVEVTEEGCTYRFDYSKVYWNSRLNTEHRRLVDNFKPGEAVCDVMAGVGPFAIPAGKKRCWVLANDLNPDSFKSLKDSVKRNKQVDRFVTPSNEDGYSFIRGATRDLLSQHVKVAITPRIARSQRGYPKREPLQRKIITRPRTFAHFILNLPASAITFLPSFIGVYARHEHLFAPRTEIRLPLIHVYCFNLKTDDNREAERSICEEIGQKIGHEVRPGNMEKEGEVSIWDVRDVAPHKRMFCASFRLPAEVAFRKI
ncbi:MAG: hypothetical protein Q9217_003867 [Psora testacea]